MLAGPVIIAGLVLGVALAAALVADLQLLFFFFCFFAVVVPATVDFIADGVRIVRLDVALIVRTSTILGVIDIGVFIRHFGDILDRFCLWL